MHIWHDNPLARYLIGDPAPNIRRRLLVILSVSVVIFLGFAVMMIVLDSPEVSCALSVMLWANLLGMQAVVVSRVRRLARKHVEAETYDSLRMTNLSPRRVIEGFALVSLYRTRAFVALLIGTFPALIVASFHTFLWLSDGFRHLTNFTTLDLLKIPVVWLRIPVLISTVLTIGAMTLPGIASNVTIMMSRVRREYTPGPADLGVALGLWVMTGLQFLVPVLALIQPNRGRAHDLFVFVLALVSLIMPVGAWRLGKWMLRMADERL